MPIIQPHLTKVVLPLLLLFVIVAPLRASEENGSPYCAIGERHYPDGIIVRVHDNYFRVCNQSYSPEHGPNSLTIHEDDSRLNLDLGAAYGNFRFYLLIWPRFYSVGYFNWFYNRLEIATETIGDARYSVKVRTNMYDRAQHLISQGKIPPTAQYVFVGPQNLGLPDHFLNCKNNPNTDPTKYLHCSIFMRYPDDGSGAIRIMIGRGPSFGPPFKIASPSGFPDMPEIVRRLHEIIKSLDVTDQIDDLRGKVPIIE